MNYAATAAGTRSLYSTVSSNMSSYRASNSSRADFFAQQGTVSQGTLQGIQGTVVVPTPTPVDNTNNGGTGNDTK